MDFILYSMIAIQLAGNLKIEHNQKYTLEKSHSYQYEEKTSGPGRAD